MLVQKNLYQNQTIRYSILIPYVLHIMYIRSRDTSIDLHPRKGPQYGNLKGYSAASM